MGSAEAESQDIAIKELILNSFYTPTPDLTGGNPFDPNCRRFCCNISYLGRLSLRDSRRANEMGPIREFWGNRS
jgi:hypothetical protein